MSGLLESQIPAMVVTISIILSGILLGIGRAINNKKIERFGAEEFTQAIINAAIFGGVAIILATTVGIGKGIQTSQCLENAAAIDELSCIVSEKIVNNLFSLFQGNIKILDILAYYQTLNLDFGSFSIQPLANVKAISDIISSQTYSMQLNIMLLNLNLQIISFISKSALELLFVFGLIFRMFFATRRLGGFLIAMSLGLYLFYPSFIMAFPTPEQSISNAMNITQNFSSNPNYAATPIIDLNDNYAIAGKIDMLSGRDNSTNVTVDFTGDTTIVIQANSQAIADSYNYSIVAPLLSLIITIVFIKEVGNILGGEIGVASIL